MFGVAEIAAAVAALVGDDDLRRVGQRRECVAVLRAVDPRPSVQPDQHGPLVNPVLIDRPSCSADVEVQSDVTD